MSAVEMALPSVPAESISREQPQLGAADRAALNAHIMVYFIVQMQESGFTAQQAAQLDNGDMEPKTVHEIFSHALTAARYRLQERSTVVTGAVRNTIQNAIRKIEQWMKGVRMLGKPDGKRLELIGFLSKLKDAFYSSVVNEGIAIEILPCFARDRVKAYLHEAVPILGSSTTAQGTDYRSTRKELIGSTLNEEKFESHY